MQAECNRTNAQQAPGFTLVELLVVITLIVVLVGLTIVAGSRLLEGGRERLTGDAIKALDSALSTYTSENGALPPPFVRDPRAGDPNITGNFDDLAWPLADARDMSGVGEGVMLNSVGLFMHHARQTPAVESILAGLPGELIQLYSPSPDPTGGRDQQPRISTVVDAWGNPIRFVHPAWHGLYYDGTVSPDADNNSTRPVDVRGSGSPVQTVRFSVGGGDVTIGAAPRGTEIAGNLALRRNNRLQDPTTQDVSAIDSDGGLVTGGRPYFYSAGPSGNPGDVEDNVYTTRPTIAQLQN
ncbi:MAG: prepilin-type N-terminal cleavage/methylation domain-containing protein [Phycisphaerales bacterium]|nr:MAG: prepilin-type N-terminal cleavage/methylation domain-containing protein [Phycisphaerales bacterium]